MSAAIGMNERFEVSGVWFLPGKAEQLQGTLIWDRRARLTLTGAFASLEGEIHGDESNDYPLIYGMSDDSRAYTVIDALQKNMNMTFDAQGFRRSETVISSIVVCGAHVSEETRYRLCRMRIPGLQMWFPIAGQPVKEFFTVSAIEAGFEWELVETLESATAPGGKVRKTGFLSISPKAGEPYEWFFSQMTTTVTLLSFLAGTPMAPDHMEAILEEGEEPVEIYVTMREDKWCRHKSVHEFYMRRVEMGIGIEAVFSKWFEIYESILMPSQLARSVFNSEDLWLHVDFLSVTQALEGFHRATMGGSYCNNDDYKKIEDILLKALPPTLTGDHRSALKSKIHYGHEFSLQRRLNDLVGRLGPTLARFVLGGDGTVPRSWIDTRNYYTHWDEGAREKVLNGADMHRASFRMKQWLRVLYLDLVGIPQTAIAKVLKGSSSDAQYLIQLNNAAFRQENPGVPTTPLMSIKRADSSGKK